MKCPEYHICAQYQIITSNVLVCDPNKYLIENEPMLDRNSRVSCFYPIARATKVMDSVDGTSAPGGLVKADKFKAELADVRMALDSSKQTLILAIQVLTASKDYCAEIIGTKPRKFTCCPPRRLGDEPEKRCMLQGSTQLQRCDRPANYKLTAKQVFYTCGMCAKVDSKWWQATYAREEL